MRDNAIRSVVYVTIVEYMGVHLSTSNVSGGIVVLEIKCRKLAAVAPLERQRLTSCSPVSSLRGWW